MRDVFAAETVDLLVEMVERCRGCSCDTCPECTCRTCRDCDCDD